MTGTMSNVLLVLQPNLEFISHTLDDQIWSKNTHCANTDTRLCGSICGTEACENNSGGTSHSTEEWLFFHQQICSLSSQCPLFQPHSIYIECSNRRSTDRIDRAISRELAKFFLVYNKMLNSLTIDCQAYLRSYYVRAQTRTS